MRLVLKKVILYACLFLTMLWLLQYFVDKGMRKSNIQNNAIWKDIYGSRINADAIIFGGSRAKLIISPKVLDSLLQINSYNLGMNGGYFPIQDAVFKVYLQHNKKPKYIIQNIDFNIFSNGANLSNSDQFIPYIDDTIIRNMASHYQEKFTLPEIYLPLFKYNNHPILIKEGLFCYFNFGHRGANKLYKGFGSRDIPFSDYFEVRMKKDADYLMNNIDKNLEAEFVSYLNYCKSNDIKLIFIYGPVLRPINRCFKSDTSEITRRIIKYAQTYNIPLINYLDDSLCNQKDLFGDHIHLNSRGAQIFSEKIGADLKNILNNH